MADFKRKNLFQLTWPLFISGVLVAATQVIDSIIVSQYSEDLMAAVSVANQILAVAYDLSVLFSVGTLVLVAQYLGRNDTKRAEQAATIGIAANAAFSFLVALAVIALGPWLVSITQTPAEIADDTLIYINVIAFAMAMNGFINAANAVLRGYGHTLELMIIAALGIVTYLGLEYVLIYGALGVPELGVWGAALSTLIIRILSVVTLIIVLAWRLDFSWKIRYGWSHVLRLTGRLFNLSYPSVGNDVAFNLYQLAILPVIATLGVGAIQARSYVFQLTMVLTVIGMVISYGNEVLVGYDRGDGDNDRARRRAIRIAIGTSIVTTALAAPMYFYADSLMQLFTDEPERYASMIAEVKAVMLVFLLYQPLQTIAYILFNSLKAVGDVLMPAIYSLAGTWFIGLPLTYLFVKYWELSVPGLMYALVATEGFKAVVMFVRWQRMQWTRFDVTERPADETQEERIEPAAEPA